MDRVKRVATEIVSQAQDLGERAGEQIGDLMKKVT
jgi:hypothetical protein